MYTHGEYGELSGYVQMIFDKDGKDEFDISYNLQ